MQQTRVDYWQEIKEVETDKLVFIDETGFWVGMERAVARSLAGHKAYSLREFYKGKKTTLIGAIKQGEVIAAEMIEGSMKGQDFHNFVKDNLTKVLKVGDVVVMDNLRSHHRQDIQELIEAVGARVVYLPVYSPEFNPIEMMWSQLKSVIRKVKTRTTETLQELIEVAINLIDKEQLKNWFTKCCYCSE